MKQTRQQLRRLYWIDATLQRRGWPSAASLARELGVSRGTIHRDLQFLRTECRAPLTFDPTEGGYSYSRRFRPSLPALPAEEALGLARNLIKQGEIGESALGACLHRFSEQFVRIFPGDLAEIDPLQTGSSKSAATDSAGRKGGAGGGEPQIRPTRSWRKKGKDAKGVGRSKEDGPTLILLRFDRVVAREVLASGLFERNQMQLLTDGGMEAQVAAYDPEALLLDLLHWAPNFEVAGPPWVRRRLPQLLRRLLRQIEGRTGAKGGTRRRPTKRATSGTKGKS